MVRLLLNVSVACNVLNEYRKNPLHYIAGYSPKLPLRLQLRDAEAITETLLIAGTNPNVRDWHGWAPIHYAAKHGKLDLIRILLAHNADPDLVALGSGKRFNAVEIARINGHDQVVECILQAQAASVKLVE